MIKMPTAKRIKTERLVHGKLLEDHYDWMRGNSLKFIDGKQQGVKTPQAAEEYMNRESEYAKDYIDSYLTENIEKLSKDMMKRRAEVTQLPPVKHQDGLYYGVKMLKTENHPIYYRKKSLKSEEEIILDVNTIDKKCETLSVEAVKPSPDGKHLIYLVCKDGSEIYEVYHKNLENGKTKKIKLNKIVEELLFQKYTGLTVNDDSTGLGWHQNSRGFYFEPSTRESIAISVIYYDLDSQTGKLLFKDIDKEYETFFYFTNNNKYIVVSSTNRSEDEVMVFDNDDSSIPEVLHFKKTDNVRINIDHHIGDEFYLNITDTQPGGRIVKLKIGQHIGDGVTIVDGREHYEILGMQLFQKYLVYVERHNAKERLIIYEISTKKEKTLTFSGDAGYTLLFSGTQDFYNNILRIQHSSFLDPWSVYDCDLKTGKLLRIGKIEVPNFDPKEYKVKLDYAIASDGEKIPVSILYKKGLNLNGKEKHPMFVYGYGQYGIDHFPHFSEKILPIVDRGIVYVLAHLRGGGIKDKEWHLDGRAMKKKNTFYDLRDVLKHFQKSFAVPEKCVIMGGSAGGTLMGYMINNYPDLFKVALALVPSTDVLNTQLDPSLPSSVWHYPELGNPVDDESAFNYIYSYCPFYNIQKRDYPSILVSLGVNDPRVHYWNTLKWLAKLRYNNTGKNPIIVDAIKGGHQGRLGLRGIYYEFALYFSFMMKEIGLF